MQMSSEKENFSAEAEETLQGHSRCVDDMNVAGNRERQSWSEDLGIRHVHVVHTSGMSLHCLLYTSDAADE